MRSVLRTLLALMLVLGLGLVAVAARAGTLVGSQALRSQHAQLAPELASNAFGEPLVIASEEAAGRIEGHAWGVLDQPFARLEAALSDPGQWCEVLMLHLNNKYCRLEGQGPTPRIELRVGRKHEQAIHAASALQFEWQASALRDDYLGVQMSAPEGPYDTRDYRLVVEAVPLGEGRSFVHMGYAFHYGGSSRMAMRLYLATIGRDKVGFTVAESAGPGRGAVYVGGLRGVVERNVMRYFLAIRSHLGAAALPPAERLEARLQSWFDATDRYPRQLHEVEREEYLAMKRSEYRRLEAHR